MRYEYIVLRNFAAISAVMNTEEIRIDFPKSETGIFLISGPNGSGKTFIQSTLHPFATNGSMDIRSDESLITEGLEGYKELKIVNGMDEYVIKHYYIPSKETHSVKSYIQKNGIELNENGNVRSFKELIEIEFGLTMDYMKLVRLGSNVTNFIDLKSTDRKAFMGLILDETELYLQCYKKVSMLMRDSKSIISHVGNSLSKLNITSIPDTTAIKESLEDALDHQKKEYERLSSQLAIVNHEISKLDSPDNMVNDINCKKSDLKDIEHDLASKKFRELNELPSQDSDIIAKKLADCNVELQVSQSRHSDILERLNTLYSDKSELALKLVRITKDADTEELRKIVATLSEEVHSLNDKYAKYTPTCTLDEYREFYLYIKSASDSIEKMYSFGVDTIRAAISLYVKGNDASIILDNSIRDAKMYKLTDMAEAVLKNIYAEVSYKEISSYKCDKKKCPYIKAYDELVALTETPIDKPAHPEEFYQYAKMVLEGFERVFHDLQEHDELFKKMPLNVRESLSTENIVSRIRELSPIFDQSIMFSAEGTISGYENYVSKKEILEAKKVELRLKESRDDVEYASNKLASVIDEINALETEDSKLTENISELSDKFEFLSNITKIAVEKSELEKKRSSTQVELGELKDSLDALRGYMEQRKHLQIEFESVKFSIENLEKRISDIQFKLMEYKRLMSDLQILNTRYDEINLTREALSSKEGIPMILIKKYLKNVHKITNELLDIAYGGELRIKQFKITDSEFKIPYVSHGKTISDVTHSSQGETSFITVALSFALMCRRIGKFNIMLLDEIDGPLDKMKRQKFIDVLFHQMEMVGSEQVFIISHNDMFDMYPVYVISTVPVDEKSTDMKMYIEIQKK